MTDITTKVVRFGDNIEYIVESIIYEDDNGNIHVPYEQKNIGFALASNPYTHSEYEAHITAIFHQHLYRLDSGDFNNKDNYGCHILFKYINKIYTQLFKDSNTKLIYTIEQISEIEQMHNEEIRSIQLRDSEMKIELKNKLKRKYSNKIEKHKRQCIDLETQLQNQKKYYEKLLTKSKEKHRINVKRRISLHREKLKKKVMKFVNNA
jgi:hypothetical protein